MRNTLDLSVIVLLVLFVFFSLGASAQTVINYEDGSTYTLGEGQDIYISGESATLYTQRTYNNGNLYFVAQKPWASRDYVPEPADEYAVGTHKWCEEYVPWSEGLTFSMISWQRYCDTNGDGAYNESDDGWEG